MKTVLITGATSGVGRAIALKFAENGYRVLALGRNEAALVELASIKNIDPMRLELTDVEACKAALKDIDIDILINNAGIMPPLQAFWEAEQADIDVAIATNFSAHVALTRCVLPGMTARNRGHVIFTGSTAGHAAFPNMAVYCATKAAIGAFAQALRLDVADFGVRVSEIVAGRIETNLYQDILAKEKREAMYSDGLAVQPAEVAEMVFSVVKLPSTVTVSRFDIVPTRQTISTSKIK